MKVRVTKLKAADKPRVATPDWGDYTPGIDNGEVSLPVEYEVEGYYNSIPKVGSSIFMIRTARNGEECEGYFASTIIQKVVKTGESYYFETENSIYQFEVI